VGFVGKSFHDVMCFVVHDRFVELGPCFWYMKQQVLEVSSSSQVHCLLPFFRDRDKVRYCYVHVENHSPLKI